MRSKGSHMPHLARRSAALLVVAVLAAAVALPACAADWLTFRNDLERHNYSREDFTPPISLVWKFTTAATKERVPPVVTADRVFCPAGSFMYCLDLATGAQLWSYDAKDDILAPPTYADGRVFFGADNGNVICVNAADGKEVWVVSTAREIRANPAVAGGTVYVVSLDRRAMALDAATGARRWSTQLTDELWAAPAVSNNMVFVPTADAQIFGLDAADGRIRMQVTLTRRRALLSPAVITEDAIYIAGRSDLRAYNRRGTERWVLDFDAFTTGAPAWADGRLYLSLIDGRVLAVDPQKGKTLWKFDFNTEMSSPPTAVGNVIIAGAIGGMVYALDAATGAPRWRYMAGPPGLAVGSKAEFDLVASPVYSNGSLYLIWDDGNLARFDVKAPDLIPPTIRLLTPAENSVSDTKLPRVVGAQVFDEESGLDAAGLTMSLDGAPVDAKYDPYTGYFTYTIDQKSPFAPLKPGWHALTITARDQRGNQITKTWRFVAQPGAEKTAGTAAPAAAQVTVSMGDAQYQPREVEVAPGATIAWVNASNLPHTVTPDAPGGPSSEDEFPNGVQPGGSFTWVVPADAVSGTIWYYHCRFHGAQGSGQALGSGMGGSVRVR
jgi:outer membrane protein assembly factor BamB/plastocyanin